MALRDVFDTAGCGPTSGNSMTAFFNGRLADREKVSEQDRWVADMHESEFNFRDEEAAMQERRMGSASIVRDFLEREDDLFQRPYFDDQGIEERDFGLHHPQDRDAHLSHILRDFVHSSTSGIPMPFVRDAMPMNLTFEEKMKIQNRTRVLVRQLARDAPPQYVDRQLESLFSSLQLDSVPIQENEDQAFLEGAWGEAQQETRLQMRRADEWAAEYQNFRQPQYFEQDFRDLEQAFSRANPALEWVDEYERFEEPKYKEEDFADLEKSYQEAQKPQFTDEQMKERYEEELWFSQFLPNGGATVGKQTANKWVDEFKHFEQGRGVNAEPGQDFVNEFVSTPAFHETEEDLREIASRFDESVTDPKLRNSNFMKFIGKINKGKVRFVDNKVVDADDGSGTGDGDEWSREYQGFT
eukprot:TRINITY_DN10548_c0_g1_i1.p1 TRINITY_DN10548_c0_g1~~TRINITY_DN10548_c0_g1_i1.p1  ORF type:complete len:437 (-),score=128.43 TRINITY_DN10548_c0_g1_i1:200-1435(-)